MTAILALLGTRAGGIFSLVLGGFLTVAVAALGLSLWLTRSDLADALTKATNLEAAITTQNAAVERLRADALAANRAASARAAVALKPRPKPDLHTIEELNTWLVTP